MFEKASRVKLRFFHKGLCTTEDLWDLPLEDLDGIYKKMNAQYKTQKEDSLLNKQEDENEGLTLGIEIVKHIVQVRLQEKQERESAAIKAEQKQKILGIIAKKQDASLEDKPIEELTKMINDL